MIQDPYCYPGTDVLKNLPGIREQALLDEFEADTVALNIYGLKERPIEGPFTFARLKETHRRIFEDVYPFAGQMRQSGGLHKTRWQNHTVFYPASNFLDQTVNEVLAKFIHEDFSSYDSATFAKRLAYFYVELDAAHPFREGNSRTLRFFMADFSRVHGWNLVWHELSKSEQLRRALYEARDLGVMKGNSAVLATLLQTILLKV